ncbi:flagellar export protein FliJ [Clostridium sp. KNHs214]|uniref:flagellar export protein FliJ n=1 Tax=Clostridium sp. KNHs214 TaxID=1540257 RepID=UPI000558790A|nr:flagellar export protein FliJ [Clostridium sp. KNHs214]
MQSFNFKLQKLLDIRENMEEQCKIEFKKVQNEKNKVEDKLQNLKENYHKHRIIDFNNSTVEKKIQQNYLNSLNISIKETECILNIKEKEVNTKREELKQKQIDKKIVGTLKEKKKQQFITEQNLIEQKNNDEFALYAYIRNNAKGGEI